MRKKILNLREGELINLFQNLNPADYGYEEDYYFETLNVDVYLEDDTYYILEYLEDDGFCCDANEVADFVKEEIRELVEYIKEVYGG